MTPPPGDLQHQAEEFAQEMDGLLRACLPGLPDPPIEILKRKDRYVIRAPAAAPGRERLPLYIKGKALASMELSVACELDSVGQYLAVHRSTYGLIAAVDRTPVLRIDYRRDMHTAPAAHIQVHGHRGALSHLLSQSGHKNPHDMASLHIPVGGSRFRPCLEDFIQFLICECRFQARPRWRSHVEAGRERYRRLQTATAVRDIPDEAARALRELGYVVEAPDAPPEPSPKALHNW